MNLWGIGRRLFVSFAALSFFVLLLLGFALEQILENRAITGLETRVTSEARTAQSALAPFSDEALGEGTEVLARKTGTRITVLSAEGVVLADSDRARGRASIGLGAEVATALSGRVGFDRRDEATGMQLFVALPSKDGRIIRLASSTDLIDGQRAAVRKVLLAGAVGLGGLLLGLSAITGTRLRRSIEAMAVEVGEVREGTPSALATGGFPELKVLSRAVNRLADDLGRRIADLADERELREEMLSSMKIGVILAEPGGALIYANSAAAAMFGRDELDSLPPHLERLGVEEVTLYHPRRIDVRATSTRLSDGRILTLLEDVTEFNLLDEVRRDFVANASHELKTPVASILASAETVASAARDDVARVPHFSQALVREAQRLARLVQDLLDLAKLEAPQDQMSGFELEGLIRREAATFQNAAKEKGLALEVTTGGPMRILGNEDAIALLVRNLLENAVGYTTEGSVSLTLDREGASTVIEVEDTGVGISASDRARIFERFYRVDRGRSRETGGTGLGLSIVRHVAEIHGGQVRVESEVGRGSRFRVTLPVLDDPE